MAMAEYNVIHYLYDMVCPPMCLYNARSKMQCHVGRQVSAAADLQNCSSVVTLML